MTYVKVDDHFHEHPKALELTPLAEALWLRGLCYASRNRTDGFIPLGFVRRMKDMDALSEAKLLSASGLWSDVEEEDGGPGWCIHDYPDWNRTSAEIDEISAKRAEAGSLGGKQKASNLLARSQDALEPVLANASKSYPTTASTTDTDTDTTIESGANAPTPRAKRATSVPQDFSVQDDDYDWATSKGLGREVVDLETEKFLLHYQAGGKPMKDWRATWRSWMLRVPEFKRSPTANGRTPPPLLERGKVPADGGLSEWKLAGRKAE